MIACTVAVAIGLYWFAISMVNDIQCILHAIHDKTQSNDNQSIELTALISEVISLHAITKQLSINFCVSFRFSRESVRIDDLFQVDT